MEKRKLTLDEIDDILNFIQPRVGIPKCIEQDIIGRQKNTLEIQLKNITVYPSVIPVLKKIIEKNYYDSLIQPGECVGIISAQCIGELGTQATLNNFHAAGDDTGSTSGIIRLQEIINANKTVKSKNIYIPLLKTFNCDIRHIKYLLTPILIYVNLNNLLYEPITIKENIVSCILSKYKLFKYKILPEKIAKTICDKLCINEQHVSFSNITDSDDENCFINIVSADQDKLLQLLPGLNLGGIPNITEISLEIEKENRPIIKTNGGTLLDIANISNNPFDLLNMHTNSIWDIYHTLGIEATKRFIVKELVSILPDIMLCHITLLADRMTYSGIIQPITRYTMRNNETPLHRASFEESFETFLKAARLNEKDPLIGVSATVMTGKKAPVGTEMCDIFLKW
jgi:DNA-directed RNA polymerase beta' subunit